jgi:hypothetical protein
MEFVEVRRSEAIANNVDEVVAAINDGKEAASFAPDAYTLPMCLSWKQMGSS